MHRYLYITSALLVLLGPLATPWNVQAVAAASDSATSYRSALLQQAARRMLLANNGQQHVRLGSSVDQEGVGMETHAGSQSVLSDRRRQGRHVHALQQQASDQATARDDWQAHVAVVNQLAVPVAQDGDGHPVLMPFVGPSSGTLATSDVHLLPPPNGTSVNGCISVVRSATATGVTTTHYLLRVESAEMAEVAAHNTQQTAPVRVGQWLHLDLSGQPAQVVSQLHTGSRVRVMVGPRPAGMQQRRMQHAAAGSALRLSHHAAVFTIELLGSSNSGSTRSQTGRTLADVALSSNPVKAGTQYMADGTDDINGVNKGEKDWFDAVSFRSGTRAVFVAVLSNCDNRIAAPLSKIRDAIIGPGSSTSPSLAGWFSICSLNRAGIDAARSIVTHVPLCFSTCPTQELPYTEIADIEDSDTWLTPVDNALERYMYDNYWGKDWFWDKDWSHFIVITPPTLDCFPSRDLGLGEVGGERVWLPATSWANVGAAAHAVLHNLGLGHADLKNPQMDSPEDLGDTTCVMGYGCGAARSCPRCPNAPHMWQLGWGTAVAGGDVEMGCAMRNMGDSLTLTLPTSLMTSAHFARIVVDNSTVYFLGYKEAVLPYEAQDAFLLKAGYGNSRKVHVYSFPNATDVWAPTVLLESVGPGATFRDLSIMVTVTGVTPGAATVKVTRLVRGALPCSSPELQAPAQTSLTPPAPTSNTSLDALGTSGGAADGKKSSRGVVIGLSVTGAVVLAIAAFGAGLAYGRAYPTAAAVAAPQYSAKQAEAGSDAAGFGASARRAPLSTIHERDPLITPSR